ncbi:unnamed protein product [Calypogeia fissa]
MHLLFSQDPRHTPLRRASSAATGALSFHTGGRFSFSCSVLRVWFAEANLLVSRRLRLLRLEGEEEAVVATTTIVGALLLREGGSPRPSAYVIGDWTRSNASEFGGDFCGSVISVA